jgi:5-methylcytosine-specific restriction endonuclease McrA
LPYVRPKRTKIDVDEARIRYELGENISEIAKSYGVTSHGIAYRALQGGWRRPRGAWKTEARRRYESGEKCEAIGAALGITGKTVGEEASRAGWQRKQAICSNCGTVLSVGIAANRAQRRTCWPCRYAKKKQNPCRTKEAKRAYRERYTLRDKGRPLLTPEQLQKQWEDQRKNAPRRKRPLVQLGRFRHYGEQPATREGALEILKATLVKLLDVRCSSEGTSREAVEYKARYRTDEVFRQREKLRSSGKRWGNRAEGRDDGTLTKEVVRKLFAKAKACPYCWQPMKSQDKSLDHMEPLSLGGWHSIDNVMVCCLRCNVKKNAMPYAEWLERIPEPCQRKLTERAA